MILLPLLRGEGEERCPTHVHATEIARLAQVATNSSNSGGGGEGASGSPPPVARQCNYYDANLLQDTRLPTTGGTGGET